MANEGDSQDRDDSKRATIVALSISVAAFFVLIPIVDTISIPLEQNNAGITSLVSIVNVSPYTEYIKFLILLLAPILVAFITLNIDQVLVNRCWAVTSSVVEKVSNILSSRIFFAVLTLTLVFLWSVNKNYIFLDFTLNDAFHEGEYLGFLPNFLTLRKPFLDSFMIHGFGLDVLTSLIANELADRSHVIVLTRFLRMTEGLIAYLGCFWIIWELILLSKFNDGSKQRVFFLLSILFIITDGIFFKFRTNVFAGRDTLFILQLALTIKFFRIVSINEVRRKFEEIALPIFVGISIPTSVLYVYDRAAYFFLLYLLTCILAVSFGKRVLHSWLRNSILGFTISAIAFIIILGFDQVAELASQMLYWIRYGKYITFVPPPPLSLNRESIVFWRYFSFAALTQVFTIFYLLLDYKKNYKSVTFWSKNCPTFILLSASLVYMRITLDRSPDAGSGSLVAAFLLIWLYLNAFKTHFENQINQILLNPLLKQWVILLVTLIILIHPALNPLLLPHKFERLSKSLKTPDIETLRQDFLESYRVLKSEIDQSSCFYTLSSEGFWYYLFNKQSCTKFSILAYAKTISAQELVVREVEEKKPSVVLFFTGGDIVSSLTPVADASFIVYQYFLNYYKPYALVAGRWFWKRDERKLAFVDHSSPLYGSINTIDVTKVDLSKAGTDKVRRISISVNRLSNQIRRGDRVWLNGTSFLANQDDSKNAVYITCGEENRLVSVAWVSQKFTWRANIPTLSLPTSSNSVLRAWSYDAEHDQLVRVGKDVKIDFASSN